MKYILIALLALSANLSAQTFDFRCDAYVFIYTTGEAFDFTNFDIEVISGEETPHHLTGGMGHNTFGYFTIGSVLRLTYSGPKPVVIWGLSYPSGESGECIYRDENRVHSIDYTIVRSDFNNCDGDTGIGIRVRPPWYWNNE